MRITLNIDLSNAKALALLNYIRTLEFVSFDEDYTLSEEEKQAIDEGIEAIEQEKVLKHKEVMNKTKKRYPNMF